MQATMMAFAVNAPDKLSKLFESLDPAPRAVPEVGAKWWARGQAASSAGSK